MAEGEGSPPGQRAFTLRIANETRAGDNVVYLRGGDDGSNDGGMPPDELKTRLEALEKRVDADMRELRADVKSLTGAVNEVSGKVSQLPSLLAIAGLVLPTVVTSIVAVAGLVFTIARATK